MKTAQEEIQDLVVDALNTIIDKIAKYGDNPDLVEFVTDAANDWINECYAQPWKDNG